MPINLCYAIVVKERNSLGKIISTKAKPVFGSMQKINEMLQTFFKNQKVNVSFIERVNLTDRTLNSRLTRKTITYSKEIEPLKDQMIISAAYYNYCLPHSALKQCLRKNTYGKYSWQERTPAMAENLTSRALSFEELLLFNPNSHYIMT